MAKTQAQLSLGISSHNNHYLFSDHYLNTILKADLRWTAVQHESDAFMQWVTALYQQEKAQFPNYSEFQLEDHWFKPIFKQLGHVYEGQAKIPGLTSGVKYPDFVFFPDKNARQQAVSQQQTQAYVQAALAAGEVKKWDIPLGKKSKGTPSFANNNPSYQIDYYLRATDLDWGLLSNGRLWRLVNKETSYKLDIYFEIDLAQAIEDQNRAAMIFFVLFFRQGAFLPDGQGRTFLDDALNASAAYTLQLEADLRDNAYKALEHLIQGFIEPPRNGLTAADLPDIYTNSLYLLYRIIFLLYGESRGLLPIENEEYQKYSLTQFAREVAAALDSGQKAAPMTDQYWHKLKQLFTIINGDQPDLNRYLGVPRYNGGLFNSAVHPFLERYFVGDRYLAAAIDVLARRQVGEKKANLRSENVDYRTLGVRQLGSIYEGLLEYQPQQAAEPMIAVKKGKREEWLPAAQKPRKAKVLDRRNAGDIYLVTDKGERKATGSYYTPDYIVKYIVEQTLEPLVENIRDQSPRHLHDAKITKSAGDFADEILKLNILDPAMGSGHFLVEATDYLARAIATDEVTDTAVVPEAFVEDDLVYWRRQVVEACIYGVDKNPMAVELAKLSLWLVTVAADKPLSFLDHHLRHGDSLVGARLQDLNSLPAKKPWRSPKTSEVSDAQPLLLDETALAQDTFKAVGGMMAIEGMLSDSIDDIHAKEGLLAQLNAHLDKWRRIADLWTSSFFGNAMSPEEYADLLRYLQSDAVTQVPGTSRNSDASQVPGTLTSTALMTPAQREQYLRHTAVLDNDYFHWELAFPEVYFDRHGRPLAEAAGFDAVIGNPPYVRQERLKAYKPFFAQRFQEVYAGTADLFVYFFKQAIDQLRQGGLTSYISSNSWLRANYATRLRAYLRQETMVKTLVDLGDNRIFVDAPDLYPAIHVVCNLKTNGVNVAKVAVYSRNEESADFSLKHEQKLFEVHIANQPDEGWRLVSEDLRKLAKKVLSSGCKLHQVIGGEMFYGVKTGFNKAFIINSEVYRKLVDGDPGCVSILRPIVNGADVRPWYVDQQDLWLICAWHGIDIEAYPSVKDWLSNFRDRLAPKPNDWKGDKWLGRKPGPYQWYEIQDNVTYREKFKGIKIFFPEMAKFPRFTISDPQTVGNKTTFMIPLEDYYLLGILMSRVTWFSIQNLCQPIGERAGMLRYMLSGQYMENLPIPEVSVGIKEKLGKHAEFLTNLSKSRYRLHQQTRHRILSDLGTPQGKLNNALSAWWSLDFPTFRAQIKKAFKRDIPLKERDEWEVYLSDACQQHQQFTHQIITLETELNRQVYALFHLTPAEIEIIETSTKYKYGEV